jgi:VPDSG-CTERM motif
MKTPLILSAFGLAASISLSQAVILPFADRGSFNAAVDADASLTKTIQGWDSLAAGTVITILDGVTYSSSSGDALVTGSFLPLSSPHTLGNTTLGFFGGSDGIAFTFATPIHAFGISFNTFATAPGSFLLTTSVGVVGSAYDPFPGFSTGQFAGLISDTPFDTVVVTSPSASAYSLDDLTYASKSTGVPDQGPTLALFALGLTGLACASRKLQATR